MFIACFEHSNLLTVTDEQHYNKYIRIYEYIYIYIYI